MPRRTKEDAEKTRETLLDAAEMVFMEKGVTATSLDDIARHAGLTRGAIYWHFDNKQDLFEAMHARVKLPMDALFEKVAQDRQPLQALKDLCIYALQNIASDQRSQRVYTILLFKCEHGCQNLDNASKMHEKRAVVVTRFQNVFTAAIEAGQLKSDITAETAAIALHAYISGLFNDYLRNPGIFDIRTMAPRMVAVFFDGVMR